LQNLGLGKVAPPDDLESDNPMLEVKESMVSTPADMIAVLDLADHGHQILTAAVLPGERLFGPAVRHRQGANGVFCDGHVEWQKTSKWNESADAARRRWNNDHQPHRETW
ncbi:MAG TPA: H-X9-DG-CTERM domain-containing protein, partial [Clostridia bacterium]|nr:H-X9-DG-CTERM domain-containing protein [Clostridia bacterium]